VAHPSSTLEPPAAETTIAVLLGASEYPQKPAWSNPVLGTSACAFRDYVVSPTDFGLMPGQVLDLFEAAAGPADQLLQIKGFLRTAGAHARDLIVYYVGMEASTTTTTTSGSGLPSAIMSSSRRSNPGSSRGSFATGSDASAST
jgi:hypothetical protein